MYDLRQLKNEEIIMKTKFKKVMLLCLVGSLTNIVIFPNYFTYSLVPVHASQTAPQSTSTVSGSFTISSNTVLSVASLIASRLGLVNVSLVTGVAGILINTQAKTFYYVYTQTGTRTDDGMFRVKVNVSFYLDPLHQRYVTGTSFTREYEPWQR